MANVKFPIGRNARAYYNDNDVLIVGTGTNGVVTTGDITTWLSDVNTKVALVVRNLTLNLDTNRVDTSTREAMLGGYMSETPVSKQAEVTFDTGWDLGNPLLPELLKAWDGDTRMAFAFLNRDKDDVVTGDIVNGWAGNCWVAMTKDENSDDVQRGNWTITHADSGIYYEVTTP